MFFRALSWHEALFGAQEHVMNDKKTRAIAVARDAKIALRLQLVALGLLLLPALVLLLISP